MPAGTALVAHAYGARVLKRLAQDYEAFATELLGALSGKLLQWAKAGGGWVVLALLESKATAKQTKAELKGAAAALKKCSAPGCRSLVEALNK